MVSQSCWHWLSTLKVIVTHFFSFDLHTLCLVSLVSGHEANVTFVAVSGRINTTLLNALVL